MERRKKDCIPAHQTVKTKAVAKKKGATTANFGFGPVERTDEDAMVQTLHSQPSDNEERMPQYANLGLVGQESDEDQKDGHN